jgi:GNAT superfamily N-acetyltransferase
MIPKLTDSDVDEAAIVWLTSGHDEYSYLPAFQRLDETSALRVFKAQIQDKSDLSVFDDNGILKGFIAIQGSSIDRLYVRPEYQRQRVSSALLQWAKNNAQGELTLFTH